MDGHYVNQYVEYKNMPVYLCKPYLVYLYERLLYICANANPLLQPYVTCHQTELRRRHHSLQDMM